jgi:hypothetical protein
MPQREVAVRSGVDMHRRTLSWLLAGFFAAGAGAALASPVPPAAGPAMLVGTVRDGESGAPLAGAVVQLPELHRGTPTDSTGRYVLQHVPAGEYAVRIRFVGYAARELHVIVPPEGQIEVNASLLPEPIYLAPIHVSAPAPARGLEPHHRTPFPDRSTSIAAIRNHPLLAEPDALQGLGGGEVVLKPEAPSGLHVRGAASDQTAYLLDGIPVYSPYHTSGLFSSWNPDMLSRLDLASAAPSPAYPHFLSGAAAAVTRAPGPTWQTQGSVSSTQARVTVDGPLGVANAGYLVAMRTGFPDGVVSHRESSYLRGDTGDWLAKLEAPAFGGQLRVLGYGSENDINTAAAANLDPGPDPFANRHHFEWFSQSAGAEWSKGDSTGSVRVLAWSASGGANSIWVAMPAAVSMTSSRRDAGLLAVSERVSNRNTTSWGIRLESIATLYRIEPDSTAPWDLNARTIVAAPFVRHSRHLGARTEFAVGAAAAVARSQLHVAPRLQVQWRASQAVSLWGTYARLHQFAQSLRNPESVVGMVFPADLYVVSGAPGVPVARSDQAVLAAEFVPRARTRFGVQVYERSFDQLLLVAPSNGEPFATGTSQTVGRGSARGVSVDVAAGAPRLTFIGSYGFQSVRLDHGESSYAPDQGGGHFVEGGITANPSDSWSLRFGMACAFARRTTPSTGGLEWESPNLLDGGAEFGGSPYLGGSLIGGAELPTYMRADVGVRRTWRFHVGGRQASVALFGTATNVLGRKNVLTYAADPTGKPVAVEMRSVTPLLVGLDWRF